MSKKNTVVMLRLLESRGLTENDIRDLARETGFCKRVSKKIAAPAFLVNLCTLAAEGTVSHGDMAVRMEIDASTDASRQAYWTRTNECCMRFFQTVLERIMHSCCDQSALEEARRQAKWKRVLVQDSTVFQLPQRLFSVFSGVSNATTAVCNVRVQGIYDLLAMRFVKFSIDPYTRNDVAATMDIDVAEGDLILRDRGYFTVASAADHQREGADSIYRFKHDTTLSDLSSGAGLDLLELLTRDGEADMQVLVGPKKELCLRLVAVPVSEDVANRRRMKAKKQIKGHAPSKKLLKFMSWSIFLTTLTAKVFTFKKVLQLYGLRWRIENIFKTWKSYFSFAKVHNVSATQAHILLTARLIIIVLLYQGLYLPLVSMLARKTDRQLSLMRFMRHVTKNLTEIIEKALQPDIGTPKLIAFLVRYCTYDKRTRPNYVARMELALDAIDAVQTLT